MTNVLDMPQFCAGKAVSFVGGNGIIRNCHSEAGAWTYLVEMALGLEPDFGRVGAETMVWLHESDLLLTEEHTIQ